MSVCPFIYSPCMLYPLIYLLIPLYSHLYSSPLCQYLWCSLSINRILPEYTGFVLFSHCMCVCTCVCLYVRQCVLVFIFLFRSHSSSHTITAVTRYFLKSCPSCQPSSPSLVSIIPGVHNELTTNNLCVPTVGW